MSDISENVCSKEEVKDDFLINERRQNYKTDEMKQLLELVRSPHHFYSIFRVSLPAFMQIKKVLTSEEAKQSEDLSEIKLLIYLLWLRSGASFPRTSTLTGLQTPDLEILSQNIFQRFCSVSGDVIFYPEDRTAELAKGMQNLTSCNVFGLAVGCLDTFHIAINEPKSDADKFLNLENHHSIQIQAICDYQGKFIDIAVGFPGSVSKLEILCSTPPYSESSLLPRGYILLSGSGYPCLLRPLCLIPPIEDQHDPVHEIFNSFLLPVHAMMSKSIGQMFSRWSKVFGQPTELDSSVLQNVVLSCSMMHNICLDVDDIWPEALHVHFSTNCSGDLVGDFASGENTRTQIAEQILADIEDDEEEEQSNIFVPYEF